MLSVWKSQGSKNESCEETFPFNSPSSRLLPTRMSMPSKFALASIDIGSDGMNSPSMVGADGKPRMPEYEFHCCTDIVLASTDRMQLRTARGDSCKERNEAIYVNSSEIELKTNLQHCSIAVTIVNQHFPDLNGLLSSHVTPRSVQRSWLQNSSVNQATRHWR